ncbi:MAG: hypothetical protein JNL52_11700 [Flavobacteriales bacterium]|nr:hypothetical protein [Flavobacteriales bacterium]
MQLNAVTFAVYKQSMWLRCALFLLLLNAAACVHAQSDTLHAPWLDREFRYWQGDPMMHGPNGECIAGYTDEERRLSFFRDGRYQEVVFEDRGFVQVRILEPGDCAPLEGDTAAVLTGTWTWVNDTLRVTVERTAQYPLEVILEAYMKRDVSRPFTVPVLPTRVCGTEGDRTFWFEGGRLADAVRWWD